MIMFGFFGSGKKQDSPAPQPQNTPQQPQRIIEKGIIKSREDTAIERGHCIRDSFGTTDLDLVLERYAPEHSDIIKEIPDTQRTIRNNQKIIHGDLAFVVNKIKEQDKKLDELGKQLKAQDVAIAALQEQVRTQSEWDKRLTGKLDFLAGAIGEIYEAVLKKQLAKESEENTPQR